MNLYKIKYLYGGTSFVVAPSFDSALEYTKGVCAGTEGNSRYGIPTTKLSSVKLVMTSITVVK